MVTIALCACALLCWPSSLRSVAPAPSTSLKRLRSAAGTGEAGSQIRPGTGARPAGARRVVRGSVAGRVASLPVRGWWVAATLVAVATASASGVGPAAACSALLLSATAAQLTSAGVRERGRRTELQELLGATSTLAREVRAGAGPVSAVLATAAAHPGRPAAVLEALAVGVAGPPGSLPSSGRPAAVARSPAGGGPERRRDHGAEVADRLRRSWAMSARYGVPWAALIDTVTADLADRQSAASRRDAQVAGPRMSGYVLAAMPALGLLLGAGMGADPLRVLMGTGVGSVLLLAGTSLTCLGLVWTASIVRG